MKVCILAGGVGSRLVGEEVKPKPMVEIGGRPILWHIMRYFAHHGFDQFVIALGQKGVQIKKYMVDYCSLYSNLTVNTGNGDIKVHDRPGINWTVDLVDTGTATMTGGRVKRLTRYLGEQTFFLVWGDGVADIDLRQMINFHRGHGKLATMLLVRPAARFGHLDLDGDRVLEFSEKPQTREGWINGGFFVLEPGALDYIAGDEIQWDREPLEQLAFDGQLIAFRHASFWQCLDTLRDKVMLDQLCSDGNAPWMLWRHER